MPTHIPSPSSDVTTLTNDSRYASLPWESKQIALQRFAEANPSPNSNLVAGFEKLRHFSEDGTPQSRAQNASRFEAERTWLAAIRGGQDEITAGQERLAAYDKAHEDFKVGLATRQEELMLASELADAENTTKASFGNLLAGAASTVKNVVTGGALGDDEFSAEVRVAESKRKELLSDFASRGYTESDIATLQDDVAIKSNAKGAPAAVDSQGYIGINDGLLIKNIDNVRSTIEGLDAPSEEKSRAISSLEHRRASVVSGIFDTAQLVGNVVYEEDQFGRKINPTINPLTEFTSLVTTLGSTIKKIAGFDNDIDRRAIAAAGQGSAGFGVSFSDEEKMTAVSNFLATREGFLDRGRIGLTAGLITDSINMVTTPLEIAGLDIAASTAEGMNLQRLSTSKVDNLADIGGGSRFFELAARIVPQVILTRKVGGAALSGAKSARASDIVAVRTAQLFATGFGGYQSATFNSRDVLDNGGTPLQALEAGIKGFGTTFLLANGLNAVGAGGIEQFRTKATASAAVAKAQLKARLAGVSPKRTTRAGNAVRGGLGEFAQEYVDEFINGLITQDFTDATNDQLATNAFHAALIGGGFGAGFGASKKGSNGLEIESSLEQIEDAADKAMEGMSMDVGSEEQSKIAARISDLNEKADSQEVIKQPDGTFVESGGLTEAETIELEQLEKQLHEGTLEEPEVTIENPSAPETLQVGGLDLKVGDVIRTPNGDQAITKYIGETVTTIEGEEIVERDFRLADGTRISLENGVDTADVVTNTPFVPPVTPPAEPTLNTVEGETTVDVEVVEPALEEDPTVSPVDPRVPNLNPNTPRSLTTGVGNRLRAGAVPAPAVAPAVIPVDPRVPNLNPNTPRSLTTGVGNRLRAGAVPAPAVAPAADPVAPAPTPAAPVAPVVTPAVAEDVSQEVPAPVAGEPLPKGAKVATGTVAEAVTRPGEPPERATFDGDAWVFNSDGSRYTRIDQWNPTVVEIPEATEAVAEETPTEEAAPEVTATTAIGGINTRNADNVSAAKLGGHYGKTGVPRKFLKPTISDELLEDLNAWVGGKLDAAINYAERSSVDPNVEAARDAEIETAELLIEFHEDQRIESEIETEAPPVVEEPAAVEVDTPTLETENETLDVLASVPAGILTSRQDADFEDRIAGATSESQLAVIRLELTKLIDERGDPDVFFDLEEIEAGEVADPGVESFPTDSLSEAKESLEDTVINLEPGTLSIGQEDSFNNRIEAATTTSQLSEIEAEIVEAIAAEVEATTPTSETRTPAVIEFLSGATTAQISEVSERLRNDESAPDIIADFKLDASSAARTTEAVDDVVEDKSSEPVDKQVQSTEEESLDTIEQDTDTDTSEEVATEILEAAPQLVARALGEVSKSKNFKEWSASVLKNVSTKLKRFLKNIWKNAKFISTLIISGAAPLSVSVVSSPDASPASTTSVVESSDTADVSTLPVPDVIALAVSAPVSTEATVESDPVTVEQDGAVVDLNVEAGTTSVVTEEQAVEIIKETVAPPVKKTPATAEVVEKVAPTPPPLTTDEKVNAILTKESASLSVLLPLTLQKAVLAQGNLPPIVTEGALLLGEQEGVGGKKNDAVARIFKKFGVNQNQDAYPWCASYCSYVLSKIGKPTSIHSSRAFLKKGKKTTNPAEGDIVVMWNENPKTGGRTGYGGHVGIYLSETPTHVLALSGNVNDSVTVTAFKKERVLGYRDVGTSPDAPAASELVTPGLTREDVTRASEDGDTVVLYSTLGVPDAAMVIAVAQDIYSGIKNLAGFAKRMIQTLGSGIKPIVRRVFHDMRRNGGVVKEANAQVAPTKKPKADSKKSVAEQTTDDSELNAEVDKALNEALPTPETGRKSGIVLPSLLAREVIDRIASKLTGTQNLVIPGLGRGVQWLTFGITKQIQNDVVGEFFEKPILSWLFGKEAAKRRGMFVSRQFLDLHGASLKVTKEGRLASVTAKNPASSLHPSDVIENVMEHGRRDYNVSDSFLRMVADWRSTRDRILIDANKEGIDLNFLKDEDGVYDNSKILDNFYFPRGTVALTEDSTAPTTFAGKVSRAVKTITGQSETPGGSSSGSRPRAKVKSFHTHRKIETEQDGVDGIDSTTGEATGTQYRYVDSPAKRIENFVTDVYSRIEDRRMATHPDIVKASGRSTFSTNAQGKRVKTKSLGKGTLSIAGKSYNIDNVRISKLNSIIEGQNQNPDEMLARVGAIFQISRGLKFTLDFSAASIQLAYLWGHSPIRGAKATSIALATSLGNRSWVEHYNRTHVDQTAEMVTLGGLYSQSTIDVDFLNDTDSTSSSIRKLLSTAVSPFTTFHTIATQIGANEMYGALRYRAVTDGKLDPTKGEAIVRFVDRSVGRESLTRNGLRASTRSLLSTVSSAPGMYAAFTNIMSDILSKDKFIRNNALKSHVRFIAGASLMFLGKAMASMMLDDEDKRSVEEKFSDALSRLNPKSKKFFTTEISLGGGRRTIMSEGGFFKSATQLSARILNDPGNAGEHIQRFLKAKKSPGIGTVLEILTQEDYFGNEITTLESLADAFQPITLNALMRNYQGSTIDVVAKVLNATTPFNWKGQSLTRIIEDKPHLTQTLEQMAFNAVGFSAYTEGSRGKFNRDIENITGRIYGGAYKSLTYDQKVAVIRAAADKGISKPVLKFVTSYSTFANEKLSKRLSDPVLRKQLATMGIYQKFAAIPKYSVDAGDVNIPIDSADHKEMYDGWLKKMVDFSHTPEAQKLTDEEVLYEGELTWENELRATGY
jgi:uncharacterized protein (TIGR02594 family)